MNRDLPSRRISQWLTQGLSQDVQNRVRRMSECDDVVRIAIMPDVHLAKEYCVGTVVATRSRIMPQAVGGDIGCGMSALRGKQTNGKNQLAAANRQRQSRWYWPALEAADNPSAKIENAQGKLVSQ